MKSSFDSNNEEMNAWANSVEFEEEINEDDNISVKSFSSASFEPDLSNLNNEGKKLEKRNYMKEYMRDYRLKQKEKAEEQRHLIIIRNQLCNQKEVERLLLNALHRLILIINDFESDDWKISKSSIFQKFSQIILTVKILTF